MGVNGQQVFKKSIFAILIVLSLMLVVGRVMAPMSEGIGHQAFAAEDKKDSGDKKKDSGDKKEKGKDDGKSTSSEEGASSPADDDEDKKGDTKTTVSYASKVFDKTDKNASKLYYNDQIVNGNNTLHVDTVQSIIDKEKKGEGEKYAAFLQSMNKWNFYKTYSTQTDILLSYLLMLFKSVAGFIILLCLVIAYMITAIMTWFAKLMDWLNIFKFMENGVSNSNPLHAIINPIVDIMHSLGYIGLVIVTLLLGVTLAMFVMGIGRASQRAQYLGRNGIKILASIVAIVVLPFMLAAFLSSYANMVKDAGSGDAIRGQITNIPKNYIVNTEGYIHGSLDGASSRALQEGNKDKAKNILTNGGYVLDRVDGLPKGEIEVTKNMPNSEFVKNINKIGDQADQYQSNDSNAKETSSVNLVLKWMANSKLTPADIDSQHSVSNEDKGKKKDENAVVGAFKDFGAMVKGLFGSEKADQKRLFQFKLAPGKESVKVFDGKRPLSGDLNEVSVQAASVAGNSGPGTVARTAEMVLSMLAVTTFVTVLLYAVISAVIKSISLFMANISIATFGSVAGLAGVVMTATMLLVSTVSAFFLITIVGSAVSDVSNAIAETSKSVFPNVNGTTKQVGSSMLTVVILWLLVWFLLKARRAIVTTVEGFFKRILDAMGLQAGQPGTAGAGAHNALNDMSHAERDGAFAPEHLKDIAKDGIDGYNDRMKHNRDTGNLSDSKFANFKDGLQGAKEGMAGSLAGKLDEAYSASQRNGMPSVGAGLAKKASDRLNKAAHDVDENGENEFTDQENATDRLDDARDEYNKADRALADAQEDLANMEAEGANAEDIDAQRAKVAEAEADLENAENNLDNAAKDVADSGATATMQEAEEAKMAEAIRDADRIARDAEQAVTDAEAEYAEMEANGATESELADKKAEIEQLKQNAEHARQYANDLKDAGSGEVHDAAGIQEAVDEKSNADAQTTAAEQELERIKETGGLTDDQLGRAKNTAKAMDNSLSEAQASAQSKATTEQEKLDGMKHIQSNGGKAFSDQDIEQQGQSIKAMHGQLANAEAKAKRLENSGFSQADIKAQQNIAKAENAKLSQLRSSGAQQETIEAQEKIASAASTKAQQMESGQGLKQAIQEQTTQVESLKSGIKAQNQIKDAMSSGRVNQSTVASGESIYSNAKQARQIAETKLDNINARHEAGETVSRTELANAQQEVQQATQQEQQAKQVLTGLKAQHATGGAVSEQGIRQQAVKTDQAHQNLEKIKEARQNLGEVIQGQGLTQQGVASMAAANQIVQDNAKRNVQNKQQAYADSSKAVQRAESQAKAGRISATELGRIKKRHELRGSELQEAQQHATSVVKEGRGIGQIGDFINKNIEAQEANVEKAKNNQNTYSKRMSAVAQRGGLGKRSAKGIRANINQERDKFRSRPNTYANSLRSSAARAQRNEEKYVNKGLDQRRHSPLMHDAMNTNRHQNDKYHPDYEKDSKRRQQESIREAKRANKRDNYDGE